MKKLLSIAALALTTLGFVSQVQAEQGKQTQVTRSNISNNRSASPTCDPSMGGDCDDADAAVSSPRDAASGQATGKRQHGSPTCAAGETCEGAEVSAPRDAASGQATGKRTHKPIRMQTADADGDGAAEAEVTTARDAGSGMATGKRTAAQDHNSSRSNKTASVAAPDGSDGGVDAEGMAIKEQGIPDRKAKTGKSGSTK